MTEARKKILVPVDFEGACTEALATARWLAGPLGADLVLLHVHHRPEFSHPELPTEMVAGVQSAAEQTAQKSLADLATGIATAETLFRHGDAAEQILAVATQIQPALVVMGTHGRRWLGRLFVGSVAAEVMRACPVPLITVRAKPHHAGAEPVPSIP